jgi:putative ATPase
MMMNNIMQQPLAERMRPTSLQAIVGQQHLVSIGKPLYNAIANKNINSIIFWGPPGTGKTTLANILAQELELPFFSLSAIESGVKDIRNVLEQARENGKALLFIDEIHRFNKSQQDSLLKAVEQGTIILIGATTENPSFEVIGALLSRCQVYVLQHLQKEDLETLLHKAVEEDVWLQQQQVQLNETAALLAFSGGDGRKLLNLLELVVNNITDASKIITDDVVQKILQQNIALYDKNGEQHYDIISAFIKSIRGSDPNAAVYYLARMITGGEDVKFIARRMLILASEDIGNANPNALLLANACFDAVSKIGYPESRIILSQTAIYLACSAKSNASYMAIETALQAVQQQPNLPVPLELRNAPTKLMKELNYGKQYQYAHNYANNFTPMEFLPEAISGQNFYQPGNNPAEEKLKLYLKSLWGDKYGY